MARNLAWVVNAKLGLRAYCFLLRPLVPKPETRSETKQVHIGEISEMSKRFVAAAILLSAVAFLPLTRAQTAQQRESGKNIHRDGWAGIVPPVPKDQTSEPAPLPHRS